MNGKICPSCGIGLSNQFVCRACGVVLPIERYRSSFRLNGRAIVARVQERVLTPEGVLWIATLIPMLLVPPAVILCIGLFGKRSFAEKNALITLPMILVAVVNVVISIALWRAVGPFVLDFVSKGVFQPVRPTSKSLTI